MSNQTPQHPLPGILNLRSLNLLAGASGLGKTALLASLAVAFRDGTTIFGEQPSPLAGLGYVCADRLEDSSREWFTAAGFPEINIYSVLDDESFDLDQFTVGKHTPNLLAHSIEKLDLPKSSLIIVDPVSIFLGGRLNDYNATSTACGKVSRYIKKTNHCIVGVCHTAKLRADVNDRYMRPQDRILGSTALHAFSETQMYLMGPDEAGRDDGRYTFGWNPHRRPEAEFTFTRGTLGLFNLDTAQRTPGKDPTETESSASVDDPKLIATLGMFPDYPQTISTVELLGNCPLIDPPITSARTLYRFLTRLQEVGKVESAGKGIWRRIPVLS